MFWSLGLELIASVFQLFDPGKKAATIHFSSFAEKGHDNSSAWYS
jgi:hypothetical protein